MKRSEKYLTSKINFNTFCNLVALILGENWVNLALFTPQDFKSKFGHFTTLCMKGLKAYNYQNCLTNKV